MDTETVALVRSTFRAVASFPGGPGALASAFYATLFATNPEAREFFPAAMDTQRDRLVRAIGHVIDRLEAPESVLPYLAQLGRDHRKYGIDDSHYSAVGIALVAALEKVCEPRMWTTEVGAAWRRAITLVTDVMMDAARSETGPPSWVGTVREHRRVRDDVAVVKLQLDQPMPYAAGQYVSVQVPGRPRMWRHLSLATPWSADGTVEFHVRRVPGGWVSPAIVDHARVGDTWVLGSPVGSLGDASDPGRDRLLIGVGTGTAPLRAQLLRMARQPRNRRTHLFVSGRYPCDLYDLEMPWGIARTNPWLTVVPVVEESADPWWFTGRSEVPAGMHPLLVGPVGSVVAGYSNWTDHDIQISGSPSAIQTIKFRLQAAGVESGSIRHDPLS
ncbi:globin domain-containing protein [Rhodococcus opacus]|uniref:nitric oxide dioxygenase n=1 Tax=Rhodococcus opacus (strain B4) TaxID=632772 RepID=C1BB95_RHOOB|nr:globin domain-containing protein [Rhodococcus opacus]BAH52948.1 putative oxidoreductase [Rhodococcus opacus B4]